MKVILQEKIANLGGVGDQVNVKPGYARNFLIPQGKAIVANEDNMKLFETRRAELEKKAADILAKAQARADKITQLALEIAVQVSEEGKLFGSIGPREVAEAATDAGTELNKSEVSLPEGPIRVVGEHEVHVHLAAEVSATMKVNVIAEE